MKQPKPIYVIQGKEESLVNAQCSELLDRLIEPSQRAVGLFDANPAEVSLSQILDELRTMDWVPRLVRSRAHKLESATKALQAELGRLPSDDEIAHKLAVSRSELDKLIRDATAVSLISLSRKHADHDSSRELQEIDILKDRESHDPVRELQKRDLRELETRRLTRVEKLILALYYYEQMTMKEIGATLDLSESRVSQMHSSILNRLRHQLNQKGELQHDR